MSQNLLIKLMNKIEEKGNKLPHPFWVFVLLTILVIIISAFLDGTSSIIIQNGNVKKIEVVNLLTAKYFVYLIENIQNIFMYFKPLSIVILLLMGIGVFQYSGALSAFIRAVFNKVPTKLIIAVVAFIGVNSNIASDASVIIIPTILAPLFLSLNLNPWLGIIIGYASVNGGFTLNTFIAGTDVISAEITNSVVKGMNINSSISPLSNWYFMSIGSLLVTILTVIVAEKITKNSLKKQGVFNHNNCCQNLSKKEEDGLKYLFRANIIYFVLVFIVAKLSIQSNANMSILKLLSNNLVGILFLYFTFTGTVFGLKSGTIKNLGDLPNIFSLGIVGVRTFIVTALPASVFVTVLVDSNIGIWVASVFSGIVSNKVFSPIILLIMFILLISFTNLFLSSASIKWLFFAPLAIPFFTKINIPPEMIQLAYRIGDTATNCISPTDYYLPIIIGLLETYKQDDIQKIGIGTVISLSMPYALAYLLGLILLFIIWYVFKIPLGPNIL